MHVIPEERRQNNQVVTPSITDKETAGDSVIVCYVKDIMSSGLPPD